MATYCFDAVYSYEIRIRTKSHKWLIYYLTSKRWKHGYAILERKNLKIGLHVIYRLNRFNLPCSLMGGNFTFDIAVHCAVLSCQFEIDIMSESR